MPRLTSLTYLYCPLRIVPIHNTWDITTLRCTDKTLLVWVTKPREGGTVTRGYEENNLGTYLVSQKKHLKLQKICCTGWNYSKLKGQSADIFQISDTKQSCIQLNIFNQIGKDFLRWKMSFKKLSFIDCALKYYGIMNFCEIESGVTNSL